MTLPVWEELLPEAGAWPDRARDTGKNIYQRHITVDSTSRREWKRWRWTRRSSSSRWWWWRIDEWSHLCKDMTATSTATEMQPTSGWWFLPRELIDYLLRSSCIYETLRSWRMKSSCFASPPSVTVLHRAILPKAATDIIMDSPIRFVYITFSRSLDALAIHLFTFFIHTRAPNWYIIAYITFKRSLSCCHKVHSTTRWFNLCIACRNILSPFLRIARTGKHSCAHLSLVMWEPWMLISRLGNYFHERRLSQFTTVSA